LAKLMGDRPILGPKLPLSHPATKTN
jgi:hypothetical protein